MSDYKIVNGKKVRVCKYGCDTELAWSDEISGFIETKGGLAHNQERCKEVKSKLSTENFSVIKQEPKDRNARIDEIIKKLTAIGMDLEALKKEG